MFSKDKYLEYEERFILAYEEHKKNHIQPELILSVPVKGLLKDSKIRFRKEFMMIFVHRYTNLDISQVVSSIDKDKRYHTFCGTSFTRIKINSYKTNDLLDDWDNVIRNINRAIKYK